MRGSDTGPGRNVIWDWRAKEGVGTRAPCLDFAPYRYETIDFVLYGYESVGMAQREDAFSYADLAIAGDMTKRAWQHLADLNARSPDPELLPDRRNIEMAKRAAVIGGFAAAGVPLYAAARLAAALVYNEFNTIDGEVPSGLGSLARGLPRAAWKQIPSDSGDNDYWFHRALIRHRDIYTPGQALDSDALVQIVDRTHVYVAVLSGTPILNPWDSAKEPRSYAGRMDGWGRDSEVKFTSASEMASHDPENPETFSLGARVNETARAADRNAVGRITVNVSLAVRNGLDRIARHRGHMHPAPNAREVAS
ncbi:hypothetical protein [Hyphomicrobium sp.]|uniref:hypothetical protein n=1 Tax=Hyphomicrobium sp. TaxID=82 RepID=UPI003F6FAB62